MHELCTNLTTQGLLIYRPVHQVNMIELLGQVRERYWQYPLLGTASGPFSGNQTFAQVTMAFFMIPIRHWQVCT
jgi:hypothetical protein